MPFEPQPPMRNSLDGDAEQVRKFQEFLAGQLAYNTETEEYVSLDHLGEPNVVAGGLSTSPLVRRPRRKGGERRD